jgi:superfamily I DNA/RNA helicase
MKDIAELEDYINKTEEMQLGMMVEIVKEYGNQIPNIIKTIKEKHVQNEDKHKAEMIFSTVHRCKGMEYDSIQLVNDFISEEKLIKLKEDKKKELQLPKLMEEINLLYVAITRTKNSIYIPETLMPSNFPVSSQIHVVKVMTEEEIAQQIHLSYTPQIAKNINKKYTQHENEKAYSVEALREKHKAAYRPWTVELDKELTVMYCEGVNIKDIMKHFGRTRGAIESRIKKLELEELYR